MRFAIDAKTISNLKLAFSELKEKFEGENRRLGIGAIIILTAFLLMIILAPLAMRSRGIFQTFLSLIPLLALLSGLFFAMQVVFKIAGSQNVKEAKTKGAIAQTAIEVAISECINCGLLNANSQQYTDCLSGVENTLNCVFLKYDGLGFCIIRTNRNMPLLIATPKKMPWTGRLPIEKKMVSLESIGYAIEAWTLSDLNSRDKGQKFVVALMPLLETCQTGGEMPYIFAQERTFILAFRNADIGSLALIGNEAAKILK